MYVYFSTQVVDLDEPSKNTIYVLVPEVDIS